ncbi:hypothetical protein A5634_16040 [Mycobacterium asiaticum]|uniref:PPE family domain-containing protein n=2 Tax=Mycobacterium asiaticum TaxID=1790 RepID=A0A1A3P9Z4_MYCAS|nr:hypothetical protein A5634_16040 [Mycobacterium asiaticum]
MVAAANAWDGLAGVLNSAAISYGSVIAGLAVESWLGPASATMAAAAAPYAGWLGAAAIQAEKTAAQARTAATAYEAAFAMTVPPPLIAANRNQVMGLVTTNILGQNSPAIEAMQAEYAEMWAQDAAAMYSYAASSELASTLPPFTAPTQAADPTGPTGRASAEAQTALSLSPITAQTLQGLAALLSPDSALGRAGPAAGIPTPIGELDVLAAYFAITSTVSMALGIVNTGRPWIFSYAGTSVDENLDNRAEQLTHATPLGDTPAAGAASASVGHAALVGALTVPHSWTVAAPEIRLAVESLPSASAGPAPTNLGAAPAALLGGMALASLAGRGAATTGGSSTKDNATGDEDPSQRKPTVVVIQQPPSGSGPSPTRS